MIVSYREMSPEHSRLIAVSSSGAAASFTTTGAIDEGAESGARVPSIRFTRMGLNVVDAFKAASGARVPSIRFHDDGRGRPEEVGTAVPTDGRRAPYLDRNARMGKGQ